MISFSVAPMDYNQTTPVTMEFHECNVTKCHCIPIVDDDISENDEIFYVTLEGTADMDRDIMLLEPVNGIIHILDYEDRNTLACKQVLSMFCDFLHRICDIYRQLYCIPGCSSWLIILKEVQFKLYV